MCVCSRARVKLPEMPDWTLSGCDRCKLWGSLQALGMGTALKILFPVESTEAEGTGTRVELSRQEAVALVHTLERLSSSLIYADMFRHQS